MKDGLIDGDTDYCFNSLNLVGRLLAIIPEPFRSKPSFRFKSLSKDPLGLAILPELQDSDAWVLVAVSHNGLAFEFASLRLRKEFILACIAVEQNHLAIFFVDASIQSQVAKAVGEKLLIAAADVSQAKPDG